MNDFLDEISQFPRGRHDDMVDCAVQALTYLRDSDSMLTGWIGQGSGAFAAGDKATAEQRAQLQKFALGGLPRTECPYFGTGGQPYRTKEEADRSLADAQKAALSGESRGQFNAPRNLGVKAKAAAQLPMCPQCGAPCAGTKEWAHCNVCHWDSRQGGAA